MTHGRQRESELRYLPLAELVEMGAAVGLAVHDVRAGWTGRPFQAGDPTAVVLLQRPED